jgi:hypothetical protein
MALGRRHLRSLAADRLCTGEQTLGVTKVN